MKKRIIGTAIALMVVSMLASTSPASAGANVVIAQPGAYPTNVFGSPVVVLKKSAPATFIHADPIGGMHDVVSIRVRPNGKPWFLSKIVGVGNVVPIEGLADTPVGEYRFKCSVHPAMQAVAHVVD